MAPASVIEDADTPEITGGALSTVTVTGAAKEVFPAASRATAVTVCAPLATVVVFHEMLYGATVTSAPRSAPSSLNCTPATPTLSEALAVAVTVPATADPEAGAVIETIGGVRSSVVKAKSADVGRFPGASGELS